MLSKLFKKEAIVLTLFCGDCPRVVDLSALRSYPQQESCLGSTSGRRWYPARPAKIFRLFPARCRVGVPAKMVRGSTPDADDKPTPDTSAVPMPVRWLTKDVLIPPHCVSEGVQWLTKHILWVYQRLYFGVFPLPTHPTFNPDPNNTNKNSYV